MIKRIVYALLKRFGGSRVKQRIWDSEFAAGKWNYLDDRRGVSPADRDMVLEVIDKYSPGGDILDLGCGTALTGLDIADVYRRYVGVDISEAAVQKAIAMLEQEGARARKNRYFVADISRFVPDGPFSVILFRESLYYFQLGMISRILRRYAAFLAANGVFIVRLHSQRKYKRILAAIEEHYQVVERRLAEQGDGIVIVFRPPQTQQCSLN